MIKFNNINPNTPVNTNITKKGETVDDLKTFREELLTQAERQVNDVGYFNVKLETENKKPFIYLSKYGVSIRPESGNDKSARMVQFISSNESKTYDHTSGAKFKGTRDEVLNYLKSDEFMQALDNYIEDMSAKFYTEDMR